MVDESTFIERAVLFVADISGEDSSSIDGDTPLLDSGFFDSLALISFLEFLEEERGSPLPISPDDGIPLDALASIRAAYRQLLATD
jgi:acyl carrier protein